MRSLFTPHTRRSQIIVSSVVPNRHVCANERNSDTYFAIVSPGCRCRVWNLYLCTISEGGGLWCCVITSTNFSYDFLPGLAGAIRLPSNFYTLGPITDRSTARFLSPSVIPLAVGKCPRRSAYCIHSSRPSSNSPTWPNCTAIVRESRIDPTSHRQCSNLLLKCGFSCNHCNVWVQDRLRETERELRELQRELITNPDLNTHESRAYITKYRTVTSLRMVFLVCIVLSLLLYFKSIYILGIQ